MKEVNTVGKVLKNINVLILEIYNCILLEFFFFFFFFHKE